MRPVPSAKIIGVFLLFSLLSACASLPGGNSSSKAANADAMKAARSRVASLEAEVTTLKSENDKLEKQLLAAKRERDHLATQIKAADSGDTEIAEAEAPEMRPITVPSPQLRNQAVVDDTNARGLAQTDVPIENSPRLVQPAFASNEMVFENEAGGEIQTASVLFGVHLASYRLSDEAREGWRQLQRENPDELGLLEPRTEPVTIPDKGMFLRLIGGGFSSNEKAQALCANLKQKGLFCSVVSFQGQRLSLAEE